jgi:uroporphyrinogen III methyltransferase/synthase
MGAEVDIAPVYRTVAAEADPAVIERIGRGDFDVVTFTSPSTVRHFAGALSMAGLDANEELGKLVKASIGPVSTRALVERGLDADIEADPSTAESLAEAIAAHFSASQQSPSA